MEIIKLEGNSEMASAKTNRILTPSWSLVPKNIELVQKYAEQIIIIVVLPALVLNFGSLSNKFTGIGVSLFVVGFLWTLVNLSASYYLQVAAARGKKLTTAECYQESWKYFLRLFLFSIAFGVLTTIGFILLIVPGLIVIRRYILTPFYIIDKDLPVRRAMQKSAEQSKPAAGYIWGIVGVMIAILLGGTIVAMFVSALPGAAAIVSAVVGLGFYFLPALRYKEVARA